MDDGSLHELSAAYALDALDGDELKTYEAHLAGCERCRADVASFRETAGALAYDVDLPPVPETLERRILESARAERPNVVPLPRRWVIPAAGVSVASVAAAIVLGIWVVHLSNSLDKQRSRNRSQNAIVSILSDCKMTPAEGASARVCIAPTRKAVLAVDNLESGDRREARPARRALPRRRRPEISAADEVGADARDGSGHAREGRRRLRPDGRDPAARGCEAELVPYPAIHAGFWKRHL